MSGRFTGRTAWPTSPAQGAAGHGSIGLTGFAEPGAMPASPYAEADGLVQWAECIALPADYLVLVGLPAAAEGG